MRREKTLRQMVSLMFLLAQLPNVACSPSPKFLILEHSRFAYPTERPITLYIPQETDMGSGYHEKVEYFELRSVRSAVIEGLQKRQLAYEVPKPSRKPWVGEVGNFFEVVEDSSNADIIVTIGIEKLDYSDTSRIADEISTFWALAILGIILTDTGPRGYVLANVKAEDRVSGERLHTFEAVGVSDSRLGKPEALQAAINGAGETFSRGLLRAR